METFPLEPDDAFELLPVEDEDVDVDEDLDAAVASALDDPFEIEPVSDPPVPLGRTWKFDWDLGRFRRHGERPAEARGEEALHEWLLGAAHTARGAHPIFSDEYGTDAPDAPIGANAADVEEALSDYEERLREAWTQHDRVSDVVDLKISFDPTGDVVILEDVVVVLDEDERFRFGPLALGTVPE